MTRPVVVLAGRQRPHEVLLLVVSVVTGLSYLLGAPPATTLAALIPTWELHAWAGGMLASGVVGLGGVLWQPRDPMRGLGLELGAMLIGAGALLLYVVAIFAVGGLRGLLGGGIVAAWTAANLWRALQIRRDLKGLT